MPNAMDVANYFLATLGSDPESDVTNLKLQKLCAYAQALSLAILKAPLFSEPLEAWKHGPVVPSVYKAFGRKGSSPIRVKGLSEQRAREPFSDEQKFILEAVKNWYGGFSAWNLRRRSHSDFPGKFGSKRAIPNDEIAARFSAMPAIRKFIDYTPPKDEGRILSEEEFWDAVQA